MLTLLLISFLYFCVELCILWHPGCNLF
jgi:hypothetical protein